MTQAYIVAMTTTSKRHDHEAHSFGSEDKTPPPVVHDPETRAAAPVAKDPELITFHDGKAFAQEEGGAMVQVDLVQAQQAANHAGNQDPAIMRKAANSLAKQFPVKS